MKKEVLMIVICLLLVALSGCVFLSKNTSPEVDNNSPKTDINNQDEVIGDDLLDTEMESRTFSKDFNGIELTVTLDKAVYDLNSIINIKAVVKNNTDENIGLFVPVIGDDSHSEIEVSITNDYKNYLIDIDTFGKGFDDAVSSLVIEPGKEYVQEMKFETYCGYDRIIATKGIYNGIATIKILSISHDTSSSQTSYSLNFELEIK